MNMSVCKLAHKTYLSEIEYLEKLRDKIHTLRPGSKEMKFYIMELEHTQIGIGELKDYMDGEC